MRKIEVEIQKEYAIYEYSEMTVGVREEDFKRIIFLRVEYGSFKDIPVSETIKVYPLSQVPGSKTFYFNGVSYKTIQMNKLKTYGILGKKLSDTLCDEN
ncbi:MAG: hypothetical protein ACHQNT_05995 [Bacteroidia bacterium]